MGSVYRVFEEQGIELVNLRDAVVELLSVQQELRMISPSTAQDIKNSFGF